MSLDLEVLLKSRIASVTSPTHSALTLLEKSRIKVVHTGCLMRGVERKTWHIFCSWENETSFSARSMICKSWRSQAAPSTATWWCSSSPPTLTSPPSWSRWRTARWGWKIERTAELISVFKVDGPKSSVALLSLVPDFHLHEQKIEAIFLVDCSGSLTVFVQLYLSIGFHQDPWMVRQYSLQRRPCRYRLYEKLVSVIFAAMSYASFCAHDTEVLFMKYCMDNWSWSLSGVPSLSASLLLLQHCHLWKLFSKSVS